MGKKTRILGADGRPIPRQRNPNIANLQLDTLFFTDRHGMNRQATDPFQSNPWVYAAVMAIARAISSTPLVVMQGAGRNAMRAREASRSIVTGHANMVRQRAIRRGDVKPAPDSHPLVKLIEDPCPCMSKSQLMQLTTIMLLTRGDEFWIKLGQTARARAGEIPVELWPQNPRLFEAVDDQGNAGASPITGMPAGWRYNGGQTVVRFDEVVHFRFVGSDFGTKGQAPIKAADDAIETDSAAVTFNKKFFQNGANPGGIFTHPGRLTPNQKTEFKDWVNAQVAGLQNAQAEMLLDNGVSFSWNPRTQKDAEFGEMRATARDEVIACIGTMKGLLSITDQLNYATFLGMKRSFYESTVVPMLYDIEDVLWRYLFADIEGGKYFAQFDLSQVFGLTDDLLDQTQIATGLFGIGYSRDEINERLGLGFEPDPATDIRNPALAGAADGGAGVVDSTTAVAPTGEGPGVAGGAVQDTALSGGQISALIQIASSVADGTIPAAAGKAIILASFPGLSEPEASDIVDGIEVKPPPEPPKVIALPPAPAPAQADQGASGGPPRASEDEATAWAETLIRGPRARDLELLAHDWHRAVSPTMVASMRAVVAKWMRALTANQIARFEAYIAKLNASTLTPQDIERILYNRAMWDAKLAETVYKPMRNAQGLELRRAAYELGVPAISVNDPALLEQNANRIATLVNTVSPGMRDILRGEMINAIAQGKTLDEMRTMIKDGGMFAKFGGEGASWRSLRIAKTEIGFVQSAARYTNAERNASIIDHRQWIHAAGGVDDRENHVAEAGGPGAKVGERYPITGLLHPKEFGAPADEVINCACDELMILKEGV